MDSVRYGQAYVKLTLLFLVALFMTTFLITEAMSGEYTERSTRFLWFASFAFGVSVVAAPFKLLGPEGYLEITPEGLRSHQLGHACIRWSDIAEIGEYSIKVRSLYGIIGIRAGRGVKLAIVPPQTTDLGGFGQNVAPGPGTQPRIVSIDIIGLNGSFNEIYGNIERAWQTYR